MQASQSKWTWRSESLKDDAGEFSEMTAKKDASFSCLHAKLVSNTT